MMDATILLSEPSYSRQGKTQRNNSRPLTCKHGQWLSRGTSRSRFVTYEWQPPGGFHRVAPSGFVLDRAINIIAREIFFYYKRLIW